MRLAVATALCLPAVLWAAAVRDLDGHDLNVLAEVIMLASNDDPAQLSELAGEEDSAPTSDDSGAAASEAAGKRKHKRRRHGHVVATAHPWTVKHLHAFHKQTQAIQAKGKLEETAKQQIHREPERRVEISSGQGRIFEAVPTEEDDLDA